MLNPSTTTEQLLFTTVRIQVQKKSGQRGTGTGFFFNFPLDEQRHIPTIITNKHVISEANEGWFQLHIAKKDREPAEPSGRFITVNLEEFEGRWIKHPDKDIDLCAMLTNPLFEAVQKEGESIFFKHFNESLINSNNELEQLSAAEDVTMVGYPIGLWDEANNFPLIRRGITSTHPSVNFNGNSIGVIDAACFPGSSGSPVLVVNEGMYYSKTGMIMGKSRAILLGVLSEGPRITAEGKIEIKEIPMVKQPVAKTNLQIHLGYYVKAKEILVLGDHIKKVLTEAGNI